MKIKIDPRWIWVMATLILLSACSEKEPKEPVVVEVGGEMTVQEMELSNFKEIEVSDMFKVEVFQEDGFKVVVELEDSLVPYQEIVTHGQVLRIGLKSGNSYHFQNAIPRVEVTLPKLTRLEINGKATVVIHDFHFTSELEIEMDDMSSLAGEFEADSIRVDIRGHSGAHLSGTAQEVSGSVIGLSTLDLANLNTNEVSVSVDNLSEIR